MAVGFRVLSEVFYITRVSDKKLKNVYDDPEHVVRSTLLRVFQVIASKPLANERIEKNSLDFVIE